MANASKKRLVAAEKGERVERRRRGDPVADLQPYAEHEAETRLGMTPLAVGWLDRRRAFPTGPTSLDFRLRLWGFCREPFVVGQTGAVQPCPVCGQIVQTVGGGETLVLGSAEIRVIGDTDIYAAPNLIYHYVVEHQYRPPDEFIQAVMTGPSPDSAEHRAFIRVLR